MCGIVSDLVLSLQDMFSHFPCTDEAGPQSYNSLTLRKDLVTLEIRSSGLGSSSMKPWVAHVRSFADIELVIGLALIL